METVKHISSAEFESRFPDSEACLANLSKLKWPVGYQCRQCGHTKCDNSKMPMIKRCSRCEFDESPTSGILLHGLKFGIRTALGCLDTSDCVAITGVGVGEIADGIAIAVFPNPTEGHVQIVFEELVQDVELMLTDVQGKLMFRQQYQDLKNTTLNLPEVPGIYFLSIKTAKGQQTMKLVKA